MATRSMPFWPRPATTSGSSWPGSGLCAPFSGRLSWSGITRAAPLPHPPEHANSLFHRRPDGPEEVGRGGPLVLGGGRARAAFGRAPGDLVLLPNPGLIGEPDLERLAADRLPDLLQTGGEVFLKAETAASFLA